MAKKIKIVKRIRKQKDESKKGAPKKVPTKKILYFVIVLALITGTYLFFLNSPYFKLDSVEVVDGSRATRLEKGDLLRTYKGRNIFDIDIRSLSFRIKNEYPVIKDAIVRRVMPDTLEIEIIPRAAIARIKSRGDFIPIDRTGMVLSGERGNGKLPVITGFSMWLRPRVGEALKNEQLESGFLLMDALKESSISQGHSVTTIDVSNYKNLSFYFKNGIEVKIGGEDFPARLKKLKKTIANPDLDKSNIKYIDLRFKDVVIGPK